MALTAAAAVAGVAAVRTQAPSSLNPPYRLFLIRSPIPSLAASSSSRDFQSLNPKASSASSPAAEFSTSNFDFASASAVRRRGGVTLDGVLSAAEALCLVPPAVCSIGCLLGRISAGKELWLWQNCFLVAAVAIGRLIRQRQRQRLQIEVGGGGGAVAGVVVRVQKVEEELREATTMIRVLSRHVEKLGVRFRVTRKTLKDPIAETAALAQQNSEATQALAMQGVALEKELGEIQKVLLAMQEQQEKQLELILAISKASRLLDDQQDSINHTDDQQDSINHTEEDNTNNTVSTSSTAEETELGGVKKVVLDGSLG